jgi:hypothetical protein
VGLAGCVVASLVVSGLVLAGRNHVLHHAGPAASTTTTFLPNPPPILSAAQACAWVVERAAPGFFTGIESVSVVYTTVEQAEAGHGTDGTVPPGDKIWVVQVQAKAINWNHSVPGGGTGTTLPATDYSAYIDPATGVIPVRGECRCSILFADMGVPVVFPPSC